MDGWLMVGAVGKGSEVFQKEDEFLDQYSTVECYEIVLFDYSAS